MKILTVEDDNMIRENKCHLQNLIYDPFKQKMEENGNPNLIRYII